MNAYDHVLKARSKGRYTCIDFIKEIFTDFTEMHGDRRYKDDIAVICGLAYLSDMPCTVIGLEKGKDNNDKQKRNFGSAHPEGYRKALRQMKLAEKFNRPVIMFVDTPGAFCGIEAEQRGQGQAIAENLYEMSAIKTPMLSVLIGEGGSGGALALAVADEVWMLENAIYSVISPEGCASILWKDSSKVKQASENLKLTAEDLKSLDVVEKIFKEDETLFKRLHSDMYELISENLKLDKDELIKKRYERYRRMGNVK